MANTHIIIFCFYDFFSRPIVRAVYRGVFVGFTRSHHTAIDTVIVFKRFRCTFLYRVVVMRDQSRDGLQRTMRGETGEVLPPSSPTRTKILFFLNLTPLCYDVGASTPVDSALL